MPYLLYLCVLATAWTGGTDRDYPKPRFSVVTKFELTCFHPKSSANLQFPSIGSPRPRRV